MKVSTKGRYALRMMVDLATQNIDGYVSLREVAERQEISMKYMEQIVSLLAKNGLLHSVRGPQGGYRLARMPEEYVVGDILRITEGNLAPVSCLVQEQNDCPRAANCTTLPFWQDLYVVITEYVDTITLADLVKNANLLG